MDAKRFTDSRPGELRKFTNPQTEKTDWLFIPNEMPPDWRFPERLWPLLATAKEALGTLNGIGQTLPNPNLLLTPLQSREAITSSSIEGTYVTPRQMLLYELDPREPTSPDEQAADWREVFNYRQTLVQGCQQIQDMPILNRDLRAMHKTLMSGVRGARKSPGEFRRVQVQIGATGRYVPPPPADVPRLMANLERYINEGDDRFDPLVLCYLVHYQIEAIHPFADGNGRIGRVLLALMVYKVMLHTSPWLYMSGFFEQHREEYADLLFRISTHGDWESWIEFCLQGTIYQALDAVTKCNRIVQMRDQYYERIKSRSTSRSHGIINWLFEWPLLNIPRVAEKWGIDYKTARKDLERLVEVDILKEIPDSRPRSFLAHELFDIAYSDQD